MADAHHVIGSMVVMVCAIACADVARPIRLLKVAFGIALLLAPLIYETSGTQFMASAAAGFVLIGLSMRPGPVGGRYADWKAVDPTAYGHA